MLAPHETTMLVSFPCNIWLKVRRCNGWIKTSYNIYSYIAVYPDVPMRILSIPRIVHQIKNPHELSYRVHSEGTEIDQVSANWMCIFSMHNNYTYMIKIEFYLNFIYKEFLLKVIINPI